MISSLPSGMKAFAIIWLGQVVSLLGSAMTWFAFTIWAWQKTGQATALSTVSFFAFLPTVLLTPLAGVLVDRWKRKLVMIFSDLATALGTLAVLLLFLTDNLQIWHIYIVGILAGFFTAFQYPAFTATVTMMVPKQHFARAEGMLGLATALSGILAPVVAAALLARIGMANIMLIDLVTFLFALAMLLWVKIPQPQVTEVGRKSRGKLWQEALFGFRYIHQRKSFLALTVLFVGVNFFLAIGATLVAPMVLSWSGDNESVLATVQSVGAVGGVIGGGLLSLWGGTRKRIHNVLLGGLGACLLGVLTLGLGRVVLIWAAGSFFFSFFEPFVEGSNIAIWQAKVEADVQGRVFSARHWLVQIPYLLGILVSGPLAEYGLASWLGVESGTGMSFLVMLAGIFGGIVFLLGYVSAPIRKAETLLPDPLPAAASEEAP